MKSLCFHCRRSASAMSLCYEARRPCNARRLCAWEERVWAWGSGKPADHEAGAMVFRHAGGIAAVVSAPHCLLVYRPVRRAPPHHATLGLHLNNIADEQEHISSSGQNIFHVIIRSRSLPATLPAGPTAPWARTTSAKGATGAGTCRWWVWGNKFLHGACPPNKGQEPLACSARD